MTRTREFPSCSTPGNQSLNGNDLIFHWAAALRRNVSVALVEQPYRVAGRRSPAPAAQLDAAWVAVVEQLTAGPLEEEKLLRVARQYERATDWHERRPPFVS